MKHLRTRIERFQAGAISILLVFFSITVAWLLRAMESPPSDQFRINNALLRELLPNVKEPRLMTVDDLGNEWEKNFFIQDGFSFIIEGDFNNDGDRDYAVAGKDASSSSTFLVVIALKHGQPMTEYFDYFNGKPKMSLALWRNCRNEMDAIVVAFTLRSDDGFYLMWDGKRYTIIKTCARKR